MIPLGETMRFVRGLTGAPQSLPAARERGKVLSESGCAREREVRTIDTRYLSREVPLREENEVAPKSLQPLHRRCTGRTHLFITHCAIKDEGQPVNTVLARGDYRNSLLFRKTVCDSLQFTLRGVKC